MTKKAAAQALAVKRMWNTAIAEGRVLRSQGGLSFQPFATAGEARAAVDRCLMAGIQADIVEPSLAIAEYVDV